MTFLVFLSRPFGTLSSPLTSLGCRKKKRQGRGQGADGVRREGNGCGGVRIEALLVKRLLSPEFLSYGSRFLDCKQWKQIDNSPKGSSQPGREAGELGLEDRPEPRQHPGAWKEPPHDQDTTATSCFRSLCLMFRFQRGASYGIVLHHEPFHCLERVELLTT